MSVTIGGVLQLRVSIVAEFELHLDVNVGLEKKKEEKRIKS